MQVKFIMNYNRIVVTGGCGFIGSNFIKLLNRKFPNVKIFNIDKLTYAGNPKNLSEFKIISNYNFHKLDIASNDISVIFKTIKPDLVVNFAAESHVDKSLENSYEFLRTNIIGTSNLILASRENKVKRYIQVSTDEVYGDLSYEDPAFTEKTNLNPSSPYSVSKASADMLVKSYFRSFDFPMIITRCSNNYGPYQYPEKLIPLVISKILENKKIPVYGKGDNIRDWIYVEDHCNAILEVIHKGRIGETYNIGGNSEISNLDLVKMIIIELGETPEDLIQFVADRPGHDFRYAIDNSKILNEIGWVPKNNFKQGLQKTIRWYLDNSDWLSDLTGNKK